MGTPTTKLLDYCLSLKTGKNSDPKFVEVCISEGADLSYEYRRLRERILHVLLQYASPECVAAAFQTKHPIDFTALGGSASRQVSPLHLVVSSADKYEAVSIFQLIIERVKLHHEDRIDFSQKTWDGLDLLSLSAKHRRLSFFWPHLKNIPLFSRDKSPFTLTTRVYWEDWSGLAQEEKLCFRLLKGIEGNATWTSKLQALCSMETESSLDEVRECIQNGADVCSTICGAANIRVLQILLRNGWMKYFEACLETENTIYFSVYYYTLFREMHPKYINDVLHLIINRVKHHPLEEFSWDVFINSAVSNDALSVWWPHLHILPPFSSSTARFPITSSMFWKDWCTLPLTVRSQFQLQMGVEWSEKSTLALQELFRESFSPEMQLIEKYVIEGADVQATSSTLGGKSVLEIVLRTGTPDQAMVLLRNIVSFDESPLFDAICSNTNSSEMLKSLLVFSVTRNVDFINWSFILSPAASFGLLQPFWSILKEFSYFKSFEGPYVLREVWKFDWEEFINAHQEEHLFSVQDSTIWEEGRSTAALFRMFHGGTANSLLIQKYVEDEASVSFGHPSLPSPILFLIIERASIDCFRAALQGSRPIDFTVKDSKEQSPLHAICALPETDDAVERLKILVERIERSPEDTFDFSQTTKKGKDFITLSASHKRLSVFWPVVCTFPYFEDKMGRIPIDGLVYLSDWNALRKEDQDRFFPLQGKYTDTGEEVISV